jgi:hypothetical protein
LLVEKLRVKEAVSSALHSVTILEKKAEEPIEHKLTHLAEAIQQLQQRITELEL